MLDRGAGVASQRAPQLQCRDEKYAQGDTSQGWRLGLSWEWWPEWGFPVVKGQGLGAGGEEMLACPW